MRITLQWLRTYLETDASLPEICRALDSLGMEVEYVRDLREEYKDFLIVRVVSANQHPNADKLKVCAVDTGNDVLQIVCGAKNVRPGMISVLAPVGTKMPVDTNYVIKLSKIRGIESHGMLCSAEELALPTFASSQFLSTKDGILELGQNVAIGDNFSAFANLDDGIIEIALTPNRRFDCASVYGIARDLAAKGIGVLKIPPSFSRDKDNTPAPHFRSPIHPKNPLFRIEDIRNCTEFYACLIDGLSQDIARTKPEYESMDPMLQKVEQGHAHPLVNISNFIMYDLGRPNHIYDANKVCGQIIIRASIAGENFVAIGGKEYILPEGLLVVADDEKILSVAGVIGGESSCIDERTTSIILELANFSDSAVLNSSRVLGIRSDASFRFSSSVPAHNSGKIFAHTIKLITNCCGGILKAEDSTSAPKISPTILEFNLESVKTFAGYPIEKDALINVLEKLDLQIIERHKEIFTIEIPLWRKIQTNQELISEIIRIHGVEHIQNAKILLDPRAGFLRDKCSNSWSTEIAHILLSQNLTEVLSFSFISNKQAEIFADKKQSKHIRILNPINQELSYMRHSLVPGLVHILEKNAARGHKNLSLFEIGPIYGPQHPSLELDTIAVLRTGLTRVHNIFGHQRNYDFYDVKDDLFKALNSIGVDEDKVELVLDTPSYYHKGKSVALFFKKRLLAYCGELHPGISDRLKLPQICIFELFCGDFATPKDQAQENRRYRPQSFSLDVKPPILSPYQAIHRDLAFLLDKAVMADKLCQLVRKMEEPLIQDVSVFDVYYGDQVEKTQQSVAIRITMQSNEKTLQNDEIEPIIFKIIHMIESSLGAKIRI